MLREFNDERRVNDGCMPKLAPSGSEITVTCMTNQLLLFLWVPLKVLRILSRDTRNHVNRRGITA